MRCYLRYLNSSFKVRVTHVDIRRKKKKKKKRSSHRRTRRTPGCGQETELMRFDHISLSSGLGKMLRKGTVEDKEEEVGRNRGRKTTVMSGRGWTQLATLERLMMGQDGKSSEVPNNLVS